MSLIFVDVEAPMGVGAPSVGDATEFGALNYDTWEAFHGNDVLVSTFKAFSDWLTKTSKGQPIFVSDNVAYDWQWINHYFWLYFGRNPFGHSGRRIGDFYAGLCGDFSKTQKWKRLRRTKHDHNPVHDATGNAEAFKRILAGEGRMMRAADPEDLFWSKEDLCAYFRAELESAVYLAFRREAMGDLIMNIRVSRPYFTIEFQTRNTEGHAKLTEVGIGTVEEWLQAAADTIHTAIKDHQRAVASLKEARTS